MENKLHRNIIYVRIYEFFDNINPLTLSSNYTYNLI
jgi:hypothetical protein